MARTFIRQSEQIDKSDEYNDSKVRERTDAQDPATMGKNLVDDAVSVEDDFNALRTMTKVITGATHWYNDVDRDMGGLHTDLAAVEAELPGLQALDSALQSSISAEEQTRQDDDDALQTLVSNLDSSIDAAESSVDSLIAEASEITMAVSDIQVDVGVAQSEIADLQDLIGAGTLTQSTSTEYIKVAMYADNYPAFQYDVGGNLEQVPNQLINAAPVGESYQAGDQFQLSLHLENGGDAWTKIQANAATIDGVNISKVRAQVFLRDPGSDNFADWVELSDAPMYFDFYDGDPTLGARYVYTNSGAPAVDLEIDEITYANLPFNGYVPNKFTDEKMYSTPNLWVEVPPGQTSDPSNGVTMRFAVTPRWVYLADHNGAYENDTDYTAGLVQDFPYVTDGRSFGLGYINGYDTSIDYVGKSPVIRLTFADNSYIDYKDVAWLNLAAWGTVGESSPHPSPSEVMPEDSALWESLAPYSQVASTTSQSVFLAADLSGESEIDLPQDLAGKYFLIYDAAGTKYKVWFRVVGEENILGPVPDSNENTPEPTIDSPTQTPVAVPVDLTRFHTVYQDGTTGLGVPRLVDRDATGSTVAAAVATAVGGISGGNVFDATVVGDTVTIEVQQAGAVTNASWGNLNEGATRWESVNSATTVPGGAAVAVSILEQGDATTTEKTSFTFSGLSPLRVVSSTFRLGLIAIDSDLDSVSSDLSTAFSDIADLETRMSTAESDVSTIESEISAVQSDIDVLQSKKVLYRRQNLADILVSQAWNESGQVAWDRAWVGIGTDLAPASYGPATPIAYTAGALGAVCANTSGVTYTAWSSATVAGPDPVTPLNLCIIRDASTGLAIQDQNGNDVYGLLQLYELLPNAPSHYLKLSFVVMNANRTGFVKSTAAAGKTINYSYVYRTTLDTLPEQAFISDKFVDEITDVNVTLDTTVDHQNYAGTPVTQTEDIEWQLADDARFGFYTQTGAATYADAFLIDAASGDTSIDVDARGLYVDATNADIQAGALVRGIDMGKTDPTTISRTAANLTLEMIDSGLGANNTFLVESAGEIMFSDGYKSASDYTGDFKLSASASEWDTFRDRFGEVSIVSVLNRMVTKGVHIRYNLVISTDLPCTGYSPGLTAPVRVGINATGDDISTRFVSGPNQLNLTSGVNLYLNGALLRYTHDWSWVQADGPGPQFKFPLKAGDKVTLVMFATSAYSQPQDW